MMQILLKKIRNHLKPLKLQQNKNLSQFTQQGGFKKVADAVRNSELFRIWSSSFNVQGYDAQCINVISEWYFYIIMVFLVIGKSAKDIEEKKKTDRKKALKS